MYRIFLLFLILKKYLIDFLKINIYFILKYILKYLMNFFFFDLKIFFENIIRIVYFIGFEYVIKWKDVGDW